MASKDHVERGLAGGFIQANHGKPAPLKRMKKGDGVLLYSPKVSYTGDEKLQAFTGVGEVAGDEIYQHQMSDGFMPFRRDVKYLKSKDVFIAPLIDELSFIENKKSWGYLFRFGMFEIPQHDFELVKSMILA